MDKPPRRIPIVAARRVAEEFGLTQFLLIGWDGERTHVVTYGKTKADCAAAAQAQDFWTGRIREFSFRVDELVAPKLGPVSPNIVVKPKRLRMPPMCEECDKFRSDPPSKLCPGCQAYWEHQR